MRDHIILTGLPGIGKTTIIKKTVDHLRSKNFDVSGFFTEEIRNLGNRIGFDIVTLDGKRGKLARTTEATLPNEKTRFKVGNYLVFPDELETLVLPIFQTNSKILIIDEIGKMELFSDKFRKAVDDALKGNDKVVLATIPVARGRPITFIEDIRHNSRNHIFEVSRTNRDHLLDEILKKLVVTS